MRKGAEGIEPLVKQDKNKQDVAVQMTSGIRNNTRAWIPDFMLKLVDEVMGDTDENRDMFQFMNPVKAAVSRVRQICRQEMPKILGEQFSRKITDAEWGHAHLTFARADLAALATTKSIRDISGYIWNA